MVNEDAAHRLVALGLSEHEARVYVVLLNESPLSTSELADRLEMPSHTIKQAVDALAARGALLRLARERAARYAAVPATEFLDQVHREHETLVGSLKAELSPLGTAWDLGCVWTITGQGEIMTRARDMIRRSGKVIYLGILPPALPELSGALREAIDRGVQVVVYTTGHVELPGSRVVVSPLPAKALAEMAGPGIILVRDGDEALIGESCTCGLARASWTRSPTIVSITEHYLIHGGRRRFMLASRFRQEN
jgi:sugar-specific transcriptional regulator TrmB